MELNHAEHFTKIETKKSAEASKQQEAHKELAEMLKMACDQVIALQEVIEEQNAVIDTMQSEINFMRTKQVEIDGTLKLAVIDQKDVNKQLRMVREAVRANTMINEVENTYSEARVDLNNESAQEMPEPNIQDSIEQEIEKNFYPKLENSRLFFKTKNKNSALENNEQVRIPKILQSN